MGVFFILLKFVTEFAIELKSGSGCGVFYYCVDTTKRRDTICESTCAWLFRSAQKSVTKWAI